jgi:hypothetical protein
MTRLLKYFLSTGVVLGTAILVGCPHAPNNPNPGVGDTTPPGLGPVSVRIEQPGSPNTAADFDITSQDVTRVISGAMAFKVTALAGDNESGIKDISIDSDLKWSCNATPPLIGTLQELKPMSFSGHTPPASPLTPWTIQETTPSIATMAGCGTLGWRMCEGYVRVTATNGATPALTTTSKTFIFDCK